MKLIFSLLTSLNNGILILFGFAIGVILLPLDTYLHELGHYSAVNVLAPITPILIELLTFFVNDNSETSDFYIAKHPEEYIYRY